MKVNPNKIRADYLKRIGFVLDFIEKNLESELSLKTLSKKANYSSFHFHRVFSAIIGESLNQYVNRKRIERIAAVLLTGSVTSIKELAYLYGFNSESSFARSFKKFYGVSPTTFKSEGKNILSKIGIAPFTIESHICNIDKINKWIEMNSQIVIAELEEIRLAGIVHIGEFDKIGALYQRLMKWGYKKEVLDLSNFKAITVYHDNPNVTPSSKVRYSACVNISKDIEAEGAIRPIAIEKGIYCVARFEIKGLEISKAWKSICIWVIENGYEFRDGDYFEIYHNDHATHPEKKFILDICIPLERTENITIDKDYELMRPILDRHTSNEEDELSYHELIKYMKAVKAYFEKEYEGLFKCGNVYQGNPEFSYFSLTTQELKLQKLKYVVILKHKIHSFSICLSGQNKSIRKKCWEMFKDSDWNQYHLVESIHNSLSIIDTVIVENPDFNNREALTKQIETESLKFINALSEVLE